MERKQDVKWRATVTEVIPAKIDQVWEILAEFDEHGKYFPQTVQSCETVEGEKNKVGSLRAITAIIPNAGLAKVKERLLSLDDVNHKTSYAVEENDFGWTGYVAHISCDSVQNDETLVKYSYEIDPRNDQSAEEYIQRQSGFYHHMLQVVKGLVAKE